MGKEKPQKIPTLPPLVRTSLESGLICDGSVGESVRPETSVSEAINMDFQTIGPASVRLGVTQIGSTLSGTILGIHQLIDTVNVPATGTQLIVVSGANVYYLSGASYNSIRSVTAGQKAHFADLLNNTFMVNGVDPTAIWNGQTSSGFLTTGSASGAPVGKYIDTFLSRVWIAGNPSYPDRLYYSTTPVAEVTQDVTWSTDPVTGVQWADISPNDGQSITALKKYRTKLLVFKQDSIYQVYGINSFDQDPYFAVGTYSQESIITTKAGLFFHHSSGFYNYNVYGMTQQISIPINDIVNAIPSSSYASVAGWIDPDGDNINWAIGTVTYGGVTYPNMVVRYRISTQVWSHRVYPTQYVCSARYNDGATLWTVVGDTAGKTHQYNLGTTDDGTAISYTVVHRWETIDGLISTRKVVQTIGFNHYGGAGSNVSYQAFDQNRISTANDWTKRVGKGQFETNNTGFMSVNIKANKLRIRISGQSSGTTFTYFGYELIGSTDELITFTQP